MKTTLKKWGNGPSIRITADIMRRANLKLGQEVDVDVVDGNVHIRLVPSEDEADLDAMIARLTPDNLHGSITIGPARALIGGL